MIYFRITIRLHRQDLPTAEPGVINERDVDVLVKASDVIEGSCLPVAG